MHTCTGTAESLRKMKTPPGALFTARPTATYVDSYESFHERKHPINSDADNKILLVDSTTSVSLPPITPATSSAFS